MLVPQHSSLRLTGSTAGEQQNSNIFWVHRPRIFYALVMLSVVKKTLGARRINVICRAQLSNSLSVGNQIRRRNPCQQRLNLCIRESVIQGYIRHASPRTGEQAQWRAQIADVQFH